MISHPYSNRAFWLSLVSIGLLLLSVVSFVTFIRTQEPNFLLAILCFFVISIAISIVSIVYASKAKKQNRIKPNEYSGSGKNSAATAISVVSLVLNVLFVLIAAFLLYLAANLFK